jgi:Phage integrase SAM-like domain
MNFLFPTPGSERISGPSSGRPSASSKSECVNDDETEGFEGVEYDLLGTGGKSSALQRGKSAALTHFNSFLATKLMSKYDQLSEDEITSKLFQEFGTYLATVAKDSKTNKPLSIGGCTNYLSYVKTTFEQKYPKSIIWNTALGGWYTSLRVALEKKVRVDTVRRGDFVVERATPLGARTLEEINHYYMGQGSKEGIKRIAALNMTRFAVGRSGEVSIASWKTTQWCNQYENQYTVWGELKTGDSDPMNFMNHLSSYLLCPIYAMSGYLLTKADMATKTNNLEDGYIFPDLARSPLSANEIMTRYVREGYRAVIKNVTLEEERNISGTSLR